MSSASLPSCDVFVPVKIEEDDIYSGIKKLLKVIRPTWPSENIKFKLFTDGITNKLVACEHGDSSRDEDIILVRIYGNKTDLLIDRNAEIRNIKTLNALGLAPKLYGKFENGLAYQYYPGVTLTVDTVKDDQIWPLVAWHMAKMHKVELGKEIAKEPFVWDKIEQFLMLLPESFNTNAKLKRYVNSFGSITKLRIEFERLKCHVTKYTESPIVFAHNDLLLGNVIYNRDEGTIAFIDYEYAMYNYQAYDIANHFNEFVGISIEDIDYNKYPNKEFQKSWIKEYLKELVGCEPSAEHVDKVYAEVQLHSLLSHFLWGVWSLVQLELSDIEFDFGKYAEIRLNRYLELKNKVLKEFS